MRTMHSTLFLLSDFQLTVAVLLAIVPFISATPYPSQPPRRGLHFRDLAVQQRDALPQAWTSLGCYTDNSTQPTLTSRWNSDSKYMTVENCIAFCRSRGTIYAGVENGQDCYCGNVTTVGAKSAPLSDCGTRCVGDHSEMCGGSDRLNLYRSAGATPPPQPTIVPTVGWWSYGGCYSDSNDSRILAERTLVNGGPEMNSVESCISACWSAGYILAGMEFANECWCDNSIYYGAVPPPIDTNYCMLACSGDSSEICGGANSIVIYYKSQDKTRS